MFTFYFFSAFLQTRNVKSPSNRPKRKTHTLLILISLTLNYNRLIILIDWNKSASARINKMKCLELLQKTEKRVSDNKNTCCWRALLKMHIDSLPAGGAFGAAETVVSLVTAVHKAVLHSWTLFYQIKWKCHWTFSEDRRFPSKINLYKNTHATFWFCNVQLFQLNVYSTMSNCQSLLENLFEISEMSRFVQYIVLHVCEFSHYYNKQSVKKKKVMWLYRERYLPALLSMIHS